MQSRVSPTYCTTFYLVQHCCNEVLLLVRKKKFNIHELLLQSPPFRVRVLPLLRSIFVLYLPMFPMCDLRGSFSYTLLQRKVSKKKGQYFCVLINVQVMLWFNTVDVPVLRVLGTYVYSIYVL